MQCWGPEGDCREPCLAPARFTSRAGARVVTSVSVGNRALDDSRWVLQRRNSLEYRLIIFDQNSSILPVVFECNDAPLLSHAGLSGKNGSRATKNIVSGSRASEEHNARIRIILKTHIEDANGEAAGR